MSNHKRNLYVNPWYPGSTPYRHAMPPFPANLNHPPPFYQLPGMPYYAGSVPPRPPPPWSRPPPPLNRFGGQRFPARTTRWDFKVRPSNLTVPKIDTTASSGSNPETSSGTVKPATEKRETTFIICKPVPVKTDDRTKEVVGRARETGVPSKCQSTTVSNSPKFVEKKKDVGNGEKTITVMTKNVDAERQNVNVAVQKKASEESDGLCANRKNRALKSEDPKLMSDGNTVSICDTERSETNAREDLVESDDDSNSTVPKELSDESGSEQRNVKRKNKKKRLLICSSSDSEQRGSSESDGTSDSGEGNDFGQSDGSFSKTYRTKRVRKRRRHGRSGDSEGGSSDGAASEEDEGSTENERLKKRARALRHIKKEYKKFEVVEYCPRCKLELDPTKVVINITSKVVRSECLFCRAVTNMYGVFKIKKRNR